MRRLLPLIFVLFPFDVFATTLQEAIEITKANNKNIKAESYRYEAAKSLKREALGEFLPSVSANAQYGQRKSNIRNTSNKYKDNKVEELKMEQPLFNGFGSIAKYNEADYKVRSADSQNLSKKQEVTLEAVEAYCDLFRYQKIFKLFEENKIFNEHIHALVEKRRGKRIIDQSDFIKFQYELSNAQNKYFESESKLTKAKFEYRNVVGDIHNDLIAPEFELEKFDEKTTVEKAIANNASLKHHHYNYLASKSAYSVEKAAFSPTVSFVTSVSKQQNSLYLGDQQFQNRSAFVNISVPIFQKGVEYSNLSKASNQSSAAREDFYAAREETIKQVGQAIQEYELFSKLAVSNQELVSLATKRVGILEKRFSAKVEDPVELLRAKLELNERHIDLINSQMDLAISYYRIKFLLGEI